MRRGELDLALRHVESEYQWYARRDSLWAWHFRIQKAHVLVVRGSYIEALQLLSDELPASLANSEAPVRRKIVQGIANDYAQHFDLADRDLSEAAVMARSSQPALLGDVNQARGNLEIHRKHYAEADAAFHVALSEARRQSLSYLEASTLGSLGYLSMWQEHYDEAISWFRSSLEESQSLNTAFLTSKIAGNMGWNYFVIGDFESAEAALKQAEDGAVQASLMGDQVKWLNTLSDVYFQQHRYDIARVTSENALSLARTVGDNRDITGCLNTLSDIALATGRAAAAEKYNKEALGIERAGLDQFGIASSTIIAGRIAAAKKQYQEAESAFQKVIQDKTVETPLRWQAQARLASVYADEKRSAKAEAEFRLAIKTIETARGAVHRDEFRVSFLSSAIEFYDDYIGFLIGQGRTLDALHAAEMARALTLEEGLATTPKSVFATSTSFRPQDIARRQNATLLFYWLGENRSYLWVITPSKMQLLPLPASSEIDASAKSYRESFLDPRDPFESGNTDGQKLYDVLIRSAEKFIPKNSRVILLPDGSLNGLNFETLIVSGPQPHYWIEDVTVSVANSLVLLARSNREPPPKSGNLLFFGNAISASKDFPPLPDSGREADILKKYFSEARSSVFTGANAKASQYLSSNPAQFSFLHFATHGTASSLRPLESAIILSPEGDSFKLYARDIVKRPLHAYLVTISACDGAGKRVYAGEGLVGLSWAFLRAGAHNVVAGLWEVSNASTPQLMDELYKGVSAGQDPATALRNAKLSLLHSGGIYRKPFYWAPFQLYSGS